MRALDNLSEQVHGTAVARPSYLAADVELVRGDVRDPQAVRRAVQGVDAVFHLAAAVGAGQAMYEVQRYTELPLPTPETKQASPSSVYALSKLDQERMCGEGGRRRVLASHTAAHRAQTLERHYERAVHGATPARSRHEEACHGSQA